VYILLLCGLYVDTNGMILNEVFNSEQDVNGPVFPGFEDTAMNHLVWIMLGFQKITQFFKSYNVSKILASLIMVTSLDTRLKGLLSLMCLV